MREGAYSVVATTEEAPSLILHQALERVEVQGLGPWRGLRGQRPLAFPSPPGPAN